MKISSFIDNKFALEKLQRDLKLTNHTNIEEFLEWTKDSPIAILNHESMINSEANIKQIIDEVSESSKIILLSNIPTYENLKWIFSEKVSRVLNIFADNSYFLEAIEIISDWKSYIAPVFTEWLIQELLAKNEIVNPKYEEMSFRYKVILLDYLKTEIKEDLFDLLGLGSDQVENALKDIFKIFWVNNKLDLALELVKK